MTKRYIPVITDLDRQLPYYLIDVGLNWDQEHVIRPNGYLYQWIQCVEGEGELLLDSGTYRVKPGMAMLLFKGAAHEYYATSSTWIVDWIVFDGHGVESFLNLTAGISTSGVFHVYKPDLFLSNIQHIWEIGQTDSTLKSIQCSSTIYSLLTDIVRYTSILPDHSATKLNNKLKPLFDYIERNVHRPLTLKELADIIGVTPQHLCNVFKKTTGNRIFQYINSVRIMKSKVLLLQYPQMKVKEIASLAGFDDANYFCTVFKKHEQLSPNQYRKIHHGD